MNSIFEVGKYYIFADEDLLVGEADNLKDAVAQAGEDELILLCMDNRGSRLPKPKVKEVCIDFEKNGLTLVGGSVNILGKYFKEGTSKFKKTDGLSLIRELQCLCDAVNIIGEPYIDGEDITNEMSDL